MIRINIKSNAEKINAIVIVIIAQTPFLYNSWNAWLKFVSFL
jgi:hypothetical protein